jgi:hypothetical protein
MQFTHDGHLYRIEFQHQRPRDWHAHRGHAVRIEVESFELYCDDCRIHLAGISPRTARILKQNSRQLHFSALSRLRSEMDNAQKRALVDRELARNVTCTIQVRDGEEWVVRYTGKSRLNVDAGDHYAREEGRLSALRHALPPADPLIAGRWEFRQAAMRAYRERPKGHTRAEAAR